MTPSDDNATTTPNSGWEVNTAAPSTRTMVNPLRPKNKVLMTIVECFKHWIYGLERALSSTEGSIS
jgi:hypothetical protein